MPLLFAYIIHVAHNTNVPMDTHEAYTTGSEARDLATHRGERIRARRRVIGIREGRKSKVGGRSGRRISAHTAGMRIDDGEQNEITPSIPTH